MVCYVCFGTVFIETTQKGDDVLAAQGNKARG
jgi:hypothetical protein